MEASTSVSVHSVFSLREAYDSWRLGSDIPKSNHSIRAISHLPILPPRWSMLPNEHEMYQRPLALKCPPTLLKLGDNASCACRDGSRAYYDPSLPSVTRECNVYTASQGFRVTVELQSCPKCPVGSRRYIGPDLRELGVFNYNNSALFSHELLNEYIIAFTGSETPMEAWVRHISYRYMEAAESIPFVTGGLFRAAWFAYARLLALEGDKHCPMCGTHPDNIIWDGVSISFGRKHVNGDLEPPTLTSDNSAKRPSKPYASQQWLSDGNRRKELRDWIERGGLSSVKTGKDKDEEKEVVAALKRVEMVPELQRWLALQNDDLGAIFNARLGWDVVDEDGGKWRPQREYVALFCVVSVALHIEAYCG
jgi:hypothetical protein